VQHYRIDYREEARADRMRQDATLEVLRDSKPWHRLMRAIV
jgi:hypothetical protein